MKRKRIYTQLVPAYKQGEQSRLIFAKKKKEKDG